MTMTPQQLYDQYMIDGYKWRAWDGTLYKSKCDTCGWEGNVPPGFTTSRPAGSSVVVYTGYGWDMPSLDFAWDIYVQTHGGYKHRQTEEMRLQIVADEAKRIAAELAAKLAAEAAQITLQKQMLESATAVWASEEVYAQSVDVINARVDAFNPQIEAYQQAVANASPVP